MRQQTFAAMVIALLAGPIAGGQAAVYNLHLATDNGPDFTDMESLVQSVTGRWKTPQEKCIAIWRWGRRSRRQTSCAHEGQREIWDPILHYNSYGAMNCGIISSLNISSFLQLGYRARYIQLGDHTVSEVSWDQGETWHLFDSSMSFFCYNHEGSVASCAEIKESHACELSGGRSEPGHYYLYHGAPQCVSHLGPGGWRCAADQPVAYERTLINGASSYTSGYSISQYTQDARFGRRYILNLLPGQSYTRYWKPLDRQQPGVAAKDKPDYYRPLHGKDPDDEHGLNNLRGNGRWVFQPDFGREDCRKLFYDDQNIQLRGDADSGPLLHPARPGQTAWVVLKVSAANVITSMRIEAGGRCRGPGDLLRVLTSRTAGFRWQTVWRSQPTSSQEIQLRLRDEVAGVTECLVKVEMSTAGQKTDVGLDRLKLTTITQLNRRTLPRLTLGTNHVRLRADKQAETTVLWPPLYAGKYQSTVFDQQNVHCAAKPNGGYKATLGAGVNDQPCHATWRVQVPSDITAVTYGVVPTNRSSNSHVSLQHSFDGMRFDEFYRDDDGGFPFDPQILHTVSRTAEMPPSNQTFLKCEFFNRQTGAATYNMAGIQDLLIRVEHEARDAHFQPVEVTYNWTEHRRTGDVTRSHTQLVTSLPYQYAVNTAGYRNPTMNWVRMNLQGAGPNGNQTVNGYSDGQDVGSRFEYSKVTYGWGKNVARGKAYRASRPSSTASKNPDSNRRELTNGVIIAPTDYTTSEAIQAATAFWSFGDPVTLVVDLGRRQAIGGVRFSTHQPNAQFCHPGRIEVAVSDDGQSWQRVGTIEHDDLWKPPGDYEPWEHDDDPSYDALPAGGRLAYSFPLAFTALRSGRYVQLICTPLPGKGMGLSELEVFDRVQVRPW